MGFTAKDESFRLLLAVPHPRYADIVEARNVQKGEYI
jgi:hypothetical protein